MKEQNFLDACSGSSDDAGQDRSFQPGPLTEEEIESLRQNRKDLQRQCEEIFDREGVFPPDGPPKTSEPQNGGAS